MVQRLEFANQLRGIAALLVVISHIIGVFWASSAGVGKLLGVEPLSTDLLVLPYGQFFIENKLLFGQFGVGVFFLISGFVIPLSLVKKNFWGFLTERIFRIYPVYMIGFTVCIIAIYLTGKFHNGSFPYDFYEVFVHYFLVIREWVGTPKIDGISWTLEIELKFYLFCALFMLVLRNYPALFLVMSAVFFFALSWIYFPEKSTWYIGRQMSALHFMIIGVAFSLFHIQKIKPPVFYSFIFINLALFSWVYSQTFLYRANPDWLIGYLLAFIVFLLSYRFRTFFKDNKILSHFADISYPLYAIHAIAGYGILYFLVKNGVSPWGSITVTFILVYILSVLIHFGVELPSLQYGKRIAQKSKGAPAKQVVLDQPQKG